MQCSRVALKYIKADHNHNFKLTVKATFKLKGEGLNLIKNTFI